MKNWQETEHIMNRARSLLAQGQSLALAVVTRIEGSTYRRPGAKLLIEPDGAMMGNISGGCLEEDVRENGLAVIQTGEVRAIHYDTSDVEDTLWGLGLGCNGKIDLQIVRLSSTAHSDVVESACAALTGDSPLLFRVNATGAIDVLPQVQGADSKWDGFEEVLEPPPTCLVFGAGDDARPLVAMAHQVGFRVIVVDHRSAYVTADRFPAARRLIQARSDEPIADLELSDRIVAVVKTHTLQHDLAWVERLIASPVAYIGLLGPRDRRDEILNRIDPAEQSRLYGPVGLDIGGEGAELVAISIVAEALAVWHQRSGGHLRDRPGTIHERKGAANE